jgi:hypothetical protein
MDNRPLAPIPSPIYNDFLFKVIGENPNGAQISVLSALAQTNIDPWEEAARLTALPKAAAEDALISILDKVPGSIWSAPEEAVIAAQLLKLLPQRDDKTFFAPGIAKASAQPLHLWLVWLSVAIAISILSSHKQKTTTPSTSITLTHTDATSPSKDDNAERR